MDEKHVLRGRDDWVQEGGIIHSLSDVLSEILRHAIYDQSDDIRPGTSKADRENECARFFLWSYSLDLENLEKRLQRFNSLKVQLLELLLTIASLLRLVYLESGLSLRAREVFAQLRSIVERTSKWQSTNAVSELVLERFNLGVYAEDREYYDLHPAQLMSDIGFHVSCLMDLLPILQSCLKEVTIEKTLPSQTTRTLNDPGDENPKSAWLPLQDSELGNALMKIMPRATPTFRERLSQIMLQHHGDQLPWICSFDDCPERIRILTKEEWADHEIRWHRSITVWVCHMCRCKYGIIGNWEAHLDRVHNVRLQGDEAVICRRLSSKIVVKPLIWQVCNFCSEQPLDSESSWEDFVDHVSSHMDAIAKERPERPFPIISQQRAESDPPATAASSKKTPFPEQQSKSGAGAISERQVGKVKWFDDGKGFGFITPEYGDNLFFRFRGINVSDTMGFKEGQRVSFVSMKGQKGDEANDVRIE